MDESAPRKVPLPLVMAFVVCRDIYRDQRTGVSILLGPTSHVPINDFPTHVRLSVWTEFTEGHGRYQPRLCLLDEADEVVWGWSGTPVEQTDPLLPHQVTFHDLRVAVPKLGRYRLVLQFNGEEVAQRALLFGPVKAFQAPG